MINVFCCVLDGSAVRCFQTRNNSFRPCLQGRGRVTLVLGLTLTRGLKIAWVYKQKFIGRVTLLPGTTQTGLVSINLVNKHATHNKFSAKTYFRINNITSLSVPLKSCSTFYKLTKHPRHYFS